MVPGFSKICLNAGYQHTVSIVSALECYFQECFLADVILQACLTYKAPKKQMTKFMSAKFIKMFQQAMSCSEFRE